MIMCQFLHKSLFAAIAVVLVATFVSPVAAQQQRSPFEVPRVSLATLPAVQVELKLTDEQKELADSLQEQLRADRREAFQSGGGDWDAMAEEIAKLSSEASNELMEKLDADQQQRLTEIYVQANGPNALFNKQVREKLKISDEQSEKLADAREENRYALFDAFQDFQGMTEEERRDAMADLQKESDKRLLKELNDEQREQFSKLSGKELDFDLSPLMPGGGG